MLIRHQINLNHLQREAGALWEAFKTWCSCTQTGNLSIKVVWTYAPADWTNVSFPDRHVPCEKRVIHTEWSEENCPLPACSNEPKCPRKKSWVIYYISMWFPIVKTDWSVSSSNQTNTEIIFFVKKEIASFSKLVHYRYSPLQLKVFKENSEHIWIPNIPISIPPVWLVSNSWSHKEFQKCASLKRSEVKTQRCFMCLHPTPILLIGCWHGSSVNSRALFLSAWAEKKWALRFQDVKFCLISVNHLLMSSVPDETHPLNEPCALWVCAYKSSGWPWHRIQQAPLPLTGTRCVRPWKRH